MNIKKSLVGLVLASSLVGTSLSLTGCTSTNIPNGYDPTIKTESQTREKSLSEKVKPYEPAVGFGAFLYLLSL